MLSVAPISRVKKALQSIFNRKLSNDTLNFGLEHIADRLLNYCIYYGNCKSVIKYDRKTQRSANIAG